MDRLGKILTSSVGQKFLVGLSGFFLFAFVITHLLGNLPLYLTDSTPFNLYVQQLHSLGTLLEVAEIGLVVLFGLHIVAAILVRKRSCQARPIGYDKTQSKGGPTLSNAASRNMKITGILLLVFVVFHVWQFRFGPGMSEGYVVELNGEPTRDLYRLVIETFQDPLNLGIYCVAMVLLGLHLRHGIWSAFQTWGLMSENLTKKLYCLAWLIAVVIAGGFFFIPLCIYFRG